MTTIGTAWGQLHALLPEGGLHPGTQEAPLLLAMRPEAPAQEKHTWHPRREAGPGEHTGSPWYYSCHFPTGVKFSK